VVVVKSLSATIDCLELDRSSGATVRPLYEKRAMNQQKLNR
jgi:hypothetical protein